MTYLNEIPYDTYGIAVWYTVDADAEYSHSDMRTVLDSDGLYARLPSKPSATSAFRKACDVVLAGQKISKAYKNMAGNYMAILYDVNGKMLGNFNLEDGEVNFYDLNDTEKDVKDSLFVKRFEKYKDTIDVTLIRQMIPRHILDELDGIALKSGMYFVDMKHAKHIEKLRGALGWCIKGLNMFLLPIPKDKEQRYMLADKFGKELLESKAELYKLMEDLEGVENPPVKKLKELEQAFDHLYVRNKYASELLDYPYLIPISLVQLDYDHFMERFK